jgi:predicted metal-dependent phosphoesterase TrpH
LEPGGFLPIEIIAITDHDSIGGYLSAGKSAEGTACRLIAGVEFSTSLDGREVHILGYFPHGIPDSLPERLNQMQTDRETRILQGLRELRKAGIFVSVEDVLKFKTGEIISRSHVARAMIERKMARSFHDAFSRYLGNEIGLFPPSRPSPYSIIEYLRKENALPVWAHPELEMFDNVIGEMASTGLMGVEVSSRYADATSAQYIERVAADFKLFVTFGSDWHGFGKDHIKGIDLERERIEPFLKHFEK